MASLGRPLALPGAPFEAIDEARNEVTLLRLFLGTTLPKHDRLISPLPVVDDLCACIERVKAQNAFKMSLLRRKGVNARLRAPPQTYSVRVCWAPNKAVTSPVRCDLRLTAADQR